MDDIVYLVLSDMTNAEPKKISFAGFRQMLVIWQRSRYFVEACGGFFLRAFQMPHVVPTGLSSSLPHGSSIKRRPMLYPFNLYPREKKIVAMWSAKGPADVD